MIASALFLEAKTHTQLSLIAVLHVEAPPTSPPTSSAYKYVVLHCTTTISYARLCYNVLFSAWSKHMTAF